MTYEVYKLFYTIYRTMFRITLFALVAILARCECEVKVFMVRHGQRVDEVSPFKGGGDPYITNKGKSESQDMADKLKISIGGRNQQYFDVVYVSPLKRTLETSEYFAKSLGKPVEVVDVLATSSSTSGLGHNPGKMKGLDWYGGRYDKDDDIKYINPKSQDDDNFWDGLNRLALQKCKKNDGQAYLLIVTHRESTKAACKRACEACQKKNVDSEYCG